MIQVLIAFLFVTISNDFGQRSEGLLDFLPKEAILVVPEEPKGTEAVQFYDFDQDGTDEAIVTYELKAKEQPAPSQFGVIVLKKENSSWKKIWETSVQGVGLHYSGLADLTGDGVKEYVFGVTIGASAGNILNIFEWEELSFRTIGDIPYHRLELLEHEKMGLAVWQRYLADAYFVDVLSWDGEQFVFDEELFTAYYPTIEAFVKERIANMNAWFYWYTLADAQIKANLFKKAKRSIQEGIKIAKRSSVTEAIDLFKQLKEKLKKEKRDINKMTDGEPRKSALGMHRAYFFKETGQKSSRDITFCPVLTMKTLSFRG